MTFPATTDLGETFELRARIVALEAAVASLELPAATTADSDLTRRKLLRSLAGVGTGAVLGTAAAALMAAPAAALAGEWQTYDPVLTASTSNPDRNEGPVNGHYLWDGRLVVVKTWVAFGVDENPPLGDPIDPGEGTYRMSLPVNAALGSDSWLGITGIMHANHSGLLRIAAVILATATTVSFRLDNDTGLVDHNTPWVWAEEDQFNTFMVYEAASDPP